MRGVEYRIRVNGLFLSNRIKMELRKVEVRRKRIVDININKNHGLQILLEMIIVTDNNKSIILHFLLTTMLFVVRDSFILWMYTFILGILNVSISLLRGVS